MILKLTNVNVEHLFDVRVCSTNMFNFWANAQDEHLQCAETFSNNSLPFTPCKLQLKNPKQYHRFASDSIVSLNFLTNKLQ